MPTWSPSIISTLTLFVMIAIFLFLSYIIHLTSEHTLPLWREVRPGVLATYTATTDPPRCVSASENMEQTASRPQSHD